MSGYFTRLMHLTGIAPAGRAVVTRSRDAERASDAVAPPSPAAVQEVEEFAEAAAPSDALPGPEPPAPQASEEPREKPPPETEPARLNLPAATAPQPDAVEVPQSEPAQPGALAHLEAAQPLNPPPVEAQQAEPEPRQDRAADAVTVDSEPAPVSASSPEIAEPPSPAELFQAVRQWVAMTPEPLEIDETVEEAGLPPRRTEPPRLGTHTEWLPARSAREAEERRPVAPVPEFMLSIGAISVVIEDPAQPPPSPVSAPSAATPARGDGDYLRFRRHYPRR